MFHSPARLGSVACRVVSSLQRCHRAIASKTHQNLERKFVGSDQRTIRCRAWPWTDVSPGSQRPKSAQSPLKKLSSRSQQSFAASFNEFESVASDARAPQHRSRPPSPHQTAFVMRRIFPARRRRCASRSLAFQRPEQGSVASL